MTTQQNKNMHTDKRYPLRACAVDAGDNRIDALRRQHCDLINAILHERIDGDQKTGQTLFLHEQYDHLTERGKAKPLGCGVFRHRFNRDLEPTRQRDADVPCALQARQPAFRETQAYSIE